MRDAKKKKNVTKKKPITVKFSVPVSLGRGGFEKGIATIPVVWTPNHIGERC